MRQRIYINNRLHKFNYKLYQKHSNSNICHKYSNK